MQFVLILLVTLVLVQAQTKSGSTGKDFFVGFPDSIIAFNSNPLSLVIGSSSATPAGYSVTAFSDGEEPVEIAAGSVDFNNPAVLPQSKDFAVTSIADRRKGLHVRSTGDEEIFVQVVSTYFNGYSNYLAYPCSGASAHDGAEDSYTYYALSTVPPGPGFSKSQVLLVACQDDTSVTITPTKTVSLPQDAQDTSSESVDVAPGTAHTLTLHQQQTLLVANLNEDITGTRIDSDRPLTVISGHECANVPPTTNSCEQLTVQVPPTYTWGYNFLIHHYTGRTSDSFIKVIAAENSTVISYRCGSARPAAFPISDAGGSFFLRLTPAEGNCTLQSSSPVFVVQMAHGGDTFTGGDGRGDPVIAIVSPTQQYVSKTKFIVPQEVDFQNIISVFVPAEHYLTGESSVLLDDQPLDCANWIVLLNTTSDTPAAAGYVCSSSVTGGAHNVSHASENGLLSVMSYGFNSLSGYAYLTGMQLQRLELEDEDEGEAIIFVESLPFFDFEGIPGNKELPREKDAVSEPIVIGYPGGIIIGNRFVASCFVSENGVISFNEPWKFAHPNRFPTSYYYSRIKDVAAPFWSDNDIRKEGVVRYAAFKRGDSTRGDEILATIDAYLETEFRGAWMILAQWDQVHPYPHGSDDHEGVSEEFLAKTNTYQGIVVTNGTKTFTLFTYTCGDIQWSSNGNRGAVVGHNAHSQSYVNHPASGFDAIGDIISCTFEIAGGSKRRRRQNGDMHTEEEEIDADERLAMARMNCEVFRRIDVFAFEGIMPAMTLEDVLVNVETCPPSLTQAREDIRFHQDPNREDCIVQKFPFTAHSPVKVFNFIQQCCYSENSLIELPDVNAGTLLAYNPASNSPSDMNNRQFDTDYVQWCCHTPGGDCGNYRQQRPSNDGTDYKPPFLATGTGDPHYRTFDRAYHHFQGIGDFIILEMEHPNLPLFQVQSRLVEWPSNCDPLPTAHFSVAFGELQTELPVGFQFVRTNEGFEVFVTLGDMDRLTSISENIDVYEDENGRVRAIFEYSPARIEASMSNGVVLQLNHWTSYINVMVSMPGEYAGLPRGMFGNLNGDGTDDFTIRGTDTIVPLLTNGDRCQLIKDWTELLESSWRIGEGDINLLEQGNPGRKKRQTDNAILLPFQFNSTAEQIAVCGDDRGCLYDFALTGDREVAIATKRDFEILATAVASLENFPPNMSGDSVFLVTLNQESAYSFSVVDEGDNVTVSVVGGLPVGASLEETGEGLYLFTWTLQAVINDSLIFQAVDSAGASSQLNPQLQICGCVNGGQCTLDGVLDTTLPVIVFKCTCPEAYGGDFCEEDRNGCSEVECFEGVECLDVPAPGTGAMCAACPTGYSGDGLNCVDIDECLDGGLAGCEQQCNNTFGSFSCNCFAGFRRVEGSSTDCEDIDECNGVNDCEQTCTNTEGSFTCGCQDGFSLNTDGRTCDALVTCLGNECSHTCAVVDDAQLCFCPPGLNLTTDGLTCVDRDECTLFQPCGQLCNNTFGSFECSCREGFNLMEDLTSCEDVNECLEAALAGTELCAGNSQCMNTPGSYQCMCDPGYTLVDDFCQRVMNVTPPEIVQVLPETGSGNSYNFTVTTLAVAELNGEKLQLFREATAEAVTSYCSNNICFIAGNETGVTGLVARPEHVAIPSSSIREDSEGNPVLSFYVQIADTFLSGESLADAVQGMNSSFIARGFIDIDECLEENGGCEHICNNTEGSFVCSCNQGYELDQDGLSCKDVNECNNENGGCEQMCDNTEGSFVCSCGQGYELGSDGLSCKALPPLVIEFINGSPRVSGQSVSADFITSEPVTLLRCKLSGKESIDCSSGSVEFTGLEPRDGFRLGYTLRIEGRTDDGQSYVLRRSFIIEHPGYCSAHLVNQVVVRGGNNVQVEFSTSSSTSSTVCLLDPYQSNRYFECASPVMLKNVEPGEHRLKIIPKGCGLMRKILLVKFTV